MAGLNNTTFFASGYKITPTTSADLVRMQESATDVAKINYTGDPEGVESANPGSTCHDPVSGNVYFKQTGTGNTGWIRASTTATDLHTAKFIVGDTTNGANYSTIQAAITAASAGDTVFIQARSTPYTENLTLKLGVNLTAFSGDSSLYKKSTTFNVNIVGKLTATFAGTCCISNVCLTTNSDFVFVLSGSAATNVICLDCFIHATNNTAVSITSSGGASIQFVNCAADLATTGIAYFACTAGGITIYNGFFGNQGASTTASTLSNTSLEINGASFQNIVTTTNSSLVSTTFSAIGASGSTAVTLSGTSSITSRFTEIVSGSATAVVIGAGCTGAIYDCTVSSSNVNALDGAGSLDSAGIFFTDSSSNINVTTQTYHTLKERMGGTGQTSYTTGDTLYASATNVLSKLAAGANGTLYTIAAGIPAFTTATYPSTTTINRILYSTAANTIGEITSANTGLLRTNSSGVPSIGNNLSGDFTFTTGTAGTTRILTVNNTNNSNTASNAQVIIAQGGTSGGYTGMTWEKGTTRSYAMGMTSGSSETLVINTTNAAGATPASGTGVWSMTNTGIQGLPLQPSASAYLNATQTNVTGDGTEATLICETELYDTGNNYNTTTGVYTVPTGGDGNYAIGMQIAFGDLAVANTTGFLHIAAGGANFYKYFNPGLATATQFCQDMNILRNLTAGQTITCSASVSGGTKIVDFNGSGNIATFAHFHKLS